MTKDDIIRMAREEAENWRSRYELISLEVSFWRKRHDMLLQAMADSAALTSTAPMFLANNEAYELGRQHGADTERERIIAQNAPEIEKINAHIKTLEKALEDEREAIAKMVEGLFDDPNDSVLAFIVDAIRARGN